MSEKFRKVSEAVRCPYLDENSGIRALFIHGRRDGDGNFDLKISVKFSPSRPEGSFGEIEWKETRVCDGDLIESVMHEICMLGRSTFVYVNKKHLAFFTFSFIFKVAVGNEQRHFHFHYVKDDYQLSLYNSLRPSVNSKIVTMLLKFINREYE